MPRGFVVTKWTDTDGLIVQLNYPEDLKVDLDDMMRVFYAHITGAAEAGIVYQSDAFMTNRVKILYRVSKPPAPRICYPAAMLRSSTQSAEARRFLEFCRTPAAAKIFEQHGFILLDRSGTGE